MPLPRVRFTVRRLMVAVAVVALMLAFGGLVSRSRAFRRRAAECRRLETLNRTTADHNRRSLAAIRKRDFPLTPDNVVQFEAYVRMREDGVARRDRYAVYFGSLGQKYERAALFPFLPVAPDPPEPE